MQDYCCVARSNYFHVKDIERFEKVIAKVKGYTNSLCVWERTDEKGFPVFGFGAQGGILGIKESPEDDNETACVAFVEALQRCVADDDAIIILEVISNQLEYAMGDAMIITSSGYCSLDMTDIAMETAAQMLNNPEWDTQCDY